MAPTRLSQITNQIRSLEPFPAVAVKVLEMSSRDDLVPGDLVEVIETDPGITSRVLKVCNSPFYGFQRTITSLRDAGNLLGLSTLVNIVMTCSASEYMQNTAQRRDEGALWRRCLTFAIASRLVAGRHGRTDPQLAYTAGLLQNIGNLVLTRHYDDGRPIIDLAVKGGRPRIDAEGEVLGMDHAEIGSRLLTRWNLPPILVDAVRHHHKPAGAEVDPVLASTIHLAETLAAVKIAGDDPDTVLYEISGAALELTGLAPEDFEAIGMDLRAELDRAGEVLGS